MQGNYCRICDKFTETVLQASGQEDGLRVMAIGWLIFSEGYRRCPRSMDYFVCMSVSMSVSLFLFSTCSLVQVTANENHLKSREVAL